MVLSYLLLQENRILRQQTTLLASTQVALNNTSTEQAPELNYTSNRGRGRGRNDSSRGRGRGESYGGRGRGTTMAQEVDAPTTIEEEEATKPFLELPILVRSANSVRKGGILLRAVGTGLITPFSHHLLDPSKQIIQAQIGIQILLQHITTHMIWLICDSIVLLMKAPNRFL